MNMKPRISILDRAFAYRPSYATAIDDTWRRFGWRPVKRHQQKMQTQPRAFGQPRARGTAKAQQTKVVRNESG
jgi:hypothetical protein